MANDINAAGYETKPWWPYVRELMSNQVTVESVTILENGVYTAPAGKAYSPVTVNVPTYEVDSLSVTENGTYTPETGNAYNSVTVNVPQTQLSSLSVTENGTYTPEAGHAYNSVVVNVPSDFSTSTVTIDATNAPSRWNLSMNLPFLANDSIESGLEISDSNHETTYSLALYKVKAIGIWYSEDCSITMTGDGSVSGENIVITGDCTISIVGPE